jgi:3-deoxy-D-manno-octulosonic-acid transferase
MTYTTDLLYLMAAPFFLPPYLYKIIVKKKYRRSSSGMLGRNISGDPWKNDSNYSNLWLHAVSVGEVVAGKAVLAEWIKHEPDTRILASTVTETGQQKARELLKEASEFTYYPFDLSYIVKRFLDHYNPGIYIMMETEIWPNFLSEAAKKNVKIFLANGKLSDRSFNRWMKVRNLFKGTFDSITAACVQTEQDREKFSQLLGRPDDILVTGNCKFDSSGKPISEEEKKSFLSRMKIDDSSPIVVVGSTHPGEEEVVLDAWEKLRKDFPDLRLILAPRHPERFDSVGRMLETRNIKYSRYTDPSLENPEIVLVDTIGVLAKLYGVGQVAILCGSFVPIGGHNLLEAAVHSIPVIYGPYMHSQPEILRIFKGSGGGRQVNKENLASSLRHLLSDESERQKMGIAASECAKKNRGSAARTVEFIRKFS